MTSIVKHKFFLFFFYFITWLGFSYFIKGGDEWKWTTNIIGSGLWALMMTWMMNEQMKSKQIYFKAGCGEELKEHLTSHGYIAMKGEDNITFFKKKNAWSFNPFRTTSIKESTYYTLIVATEKILENIPSHFQKIREPYTAS